MDKSITYTLSIPHWHPPLKNAYNKGRTIQARAWRKRDLRRSTASLLFILKKQHKIPDATTPMRLKIRIILGKGQRGGDPDGYTECLLDALQDAALIRNDNKNWVETEHPIVHRAKEGEAWGTILELTSMPKKKQPTL